MLFEKTCEDFFVNTIVAILRRKTEACQPPTKKRKITLISYHFLCFSSSILFKTISDYYKVNTALKQLFQCEKCIHELEQWGDLCLSIYEIVCLYYVESCLPFVINTDLTYNVNLLQIVNFLDRKGYLVTYESDSEVLAKPLAVNIRGGIYGDDVTYCCCPKPHEHEIYGTL